MNKVFVSRYLWSHLSRRRILRRLEKEGKAKLIDTTHKGWIYQTSVEIKEKPKHKVYQ